MNSVCRNIFLLAVFASAGVAVSNPARTATDDRHVLVQALKDRFYPVVEGGIQETCPKNGGSWHDRTLDDAAVKGSFREDSVAFCDSYIAAQRHLDNDNLIPWEAYEFYAYRRDLSLDNRYMRLLVGPFLSRRECDAHRTEVIKSEVDVTLCEPVALN